MAHFAEIRTDNNEVLRVVVVNNSDVNANGGDLSTEAETWVANNIPQDPLILEEFIQEQDIFMTPLMILLNHHNLMIIGFGMKQIGIGNHL